MAQLNLLERATDVSVILNNKKRDVMDIWFRGIKVWPKSESDPELSVDKNEVILNKSNNWSDVLKVFASNNQTWEFGID